MTALLVSIVCCAAWVYLMGFRGRFWSSMPVLDAGLSDGRAKVAVIVPARNEAESIGRSIGSLLAQEYRGDLAVILIDDNSTDETGAIAAAMGADRRLSIVAGAPLPPGWSGKLWAVQQGLDHPKAKAADYVLLTDADIEHATEHVAMLVDKAERDGLDLVSEMVRLRCVTLVERALIPAFVFFFQMLYPFAWVADPAKKTAGAAGGTMLMRRAVLDSIGGVTEIRGRLIDDCALAERIKRSDGRIWLGHAERATSIRGYEQWRQVWDMIARTAYEQLGRSPLMLAGCAMGMGLLYLAPMGLAVFAGGAARWLGLGCWAAMAVAFQPTLRRYRVSPAWGAAMPGISLFYLGATVASALRYYAGRGGGWKDRVYPGAGG